MAFEKGYDNELYLKRQSEAILKRIASFDGKLYLEFGGKILYDYHAARVLPGFDPNVKMRLLHQLRNQAEIIICIYAGDIEKKKLRADFGITYDVDALKLIDDMRAWEINVRAVVITRYDEQPSAVQFKRKLERHNVPVYTHRRIKGYPADVDLIVSDNGYGANDYISTSKPLVVVTAPGPGSGKMSTCLSQMYHDYKRGIQAGYAKFETFPIWNLPLQHPVNVAYEAATAELRDFNMIDPFHLETYDEKAVNYNRDVETFPVLKRILEKISGMELPYMSPTDMGVNCAGFGIVNDDAVRFASTQEVIRRYFRYSCEYMMGLVDRETVNRIEIIMDKLNVKQTARAVVSPARDAAERACNGQVEPGRFCCGAAIELPDGRIVTGKNSQLMHAPSSVILNAIKTMAGIPDVLHLLSPSIIDSIAKMKKDIINDPAVRLDLEETLIALSISAPTNPTAQLAMDRLKELRGCEMHLTHIPSQGDEAGLRRLGINVTSDPVFASESLYPGA